MIFSIFSRIFSFREIWITKEPAIEPTDFLEVIKKYAPRFSEGNQEDIQEFLIYLLDIIHEDLNRVFKAGIENIENSKNQQIQIEIGDLMEKNLEIENLSELELAAAKEWQSYLKRNRSIIVDLFQVNSFIIHIYNPSNNYIRDK